MTAGSAEKPPQVGTENETPSDVEKTSPIQAKESGTEEEKLETLRLEYGVCNTLFPFMSWHPNTIQSTWPSPTSPLNPFNWPTHRKILIGTIFSFGQLIPIMSASMIAPSLGDIAGDLHISASTAQITLSSYFLGMAFAPLVIAALSEMYGRKRVWVACNAWYVIWNALCPVGRSAGLMIVGRVMTGAGACVGVTVSLHINRAEEKLTVVAQWACHGGYVWQKGSRKVSRHRYTASIFRTGSRAFDRRSGDSVYSLVVGFLDHEYYRCSRVTPWSLHHTRNVHAGAFATQSYARRYSSTSQEIAHKD